MAVTKVISPGVFIRGVVLGEFGVDNLTEKGLLNSVLRTTFWDAKGWSDVKLQVGFTQLQLSIPENVKIWQDILTDHETNLSLGGELKEVLRDLVFVNAYPILTSADPAVYTDGMRIVNLFLQHLVFFEKALQLPLNWQRLQ